MTVNIAVEGPSDQRVLEELLARAAPRGSIKWWVANSSSLAYAQSVMIGRHEPVALVVDSDVLGPHNPSRRRSELRESLLRHGTEGLDWVLIVLDSPMGVHGKDLLQQQPELQDLIDFVRLHASAHDCRIKLDTSKRAATFRSTELPGVQVIRADFLLSSVEWVYRMSQMVLNCTYSLRWGRYHASQSLGWAFGGEDMGNMSRPSFSLEGRWWSRATRPPWFNKVKDPEWETTLELRGESALVAGESASFEVRVDRSMNLVANSE